MFDVPTVGESNYSWIEEFIGFLKEIIAMIQALFAGINVITGEPLPTKEAAAEE